MNIYKYSKSTQQVYQGMRSWILQQLPYVGEEGVALFIKRFDDDLEELLTHGIPSIKAVKGDVPDDLLEMGLITAIIKKLMEKMSRCRFIVGSDEDMRKHIIGEGVDPDAADEMMASAPKLGGRGCLIKGMHTLRKPTPAEESSAERMMRSVLDKSRGIGDDDDDDNPPTLQ
jgi:hypothetical protein